MRLLSSNMEAKFGCLICKKKKILIGESCFSQKEKSEFDEKKKFMIAEGQIFTYE